MWNEPTQNQLNQIPKLYETENIPTKEKIIYEHFFIFGCDWYIAEYDGNDIFFGYTILNSDYVNSEWGYISYDELKSVKINGFEVERELNWKPKQFSEIEKSELCLQIDN